MTMTKLKNTDPRQNPSPEILDRLFQNLFELLLTNVLFMLCSLPLITAGPAAIALERICCQIHREEKVPVFQIFFQTFGRYFGRGLFLSIVVLPLFLFSGLCIFAFYSEERLGLMALCAVMFLLASGLLQYLAPLVSATELPFEKQLKNAAILLFLCPLRTLAGGIGSLSLLLLLLWQPKFMLALCFVILLSVHGYFRSYLALQGAQKYIFDPYYASKEKNIRVR